MKNKETALGRALTLHFFLSLTVSLMLPFLNGTGAASEIYTLVFTAVRYLIPIVYYRRATAYTPFVSPISEKYAEKKHSFFGSATTLIFSVTVTVVALNSVGALGDLFLSLFGEPPTASDAITENNAVFVLIKSVIFASFFEEMLFRGAVLHALSDRKPAIRILISATFFALMHCNVLQFFYAFTTGAIISFFAVMHNSLALAAVIHLCANLVTFILSLLRGTLSEGHFKTVSVLTFVTFTLLAVLFSVPYFLKICKKNTEQGETKADAVPKEMWIYVLVTAAFTAIGAFTG